MLTKTMTIFIFLGLIALTALASAFLILLISKMGIRDCIIEDAPKGISRLFACDFCLSFWVACILIASLSIAVIVIDLASHPGNCIYAIPFFSAPITRILI